MNIETQYKLRTANEYILKNLSDVEGSFVKKLGDKKKERIKTVYVRALEIAGDELEAMLPKPVTWDQSKVCLEANREAVEIAKRLIDTYDTLESSDLIDEYKQAQAALLELEKKLNAEFGSKLATYKRIQGYK